MFIQRRPVRLRITRLGRRAGQVEVEQVHNARMP
jgi:hypothetical protein